MACTAGWESIVNLLLVFALFLLQRQSQQPQSSLIKYNRYRHYRILRFSVGLWDYVFVYQHEVNDQIWRVKPNKTLKKNFNNNFHLNSVLCCLDVFAYRIPRQWHVQTRETGKGKSMIMFSSLIYETKQLKWINRLPSSASRWKSTENGNRNRHYVWVSLSGYR